jgi:hypothetical protein
MGGIFSLTTDGFGVIWPDVLHEGHCNTNGFLLSIFDFFIANIAEQFGHLKWLSDPLRDFLNN